MPRPVTLFTGQWADLPLAELAPHAEQMGYDGLELACWGDHFDVDSGARATRATCADKRALLERTACSASRSRTTSSARRCATSSTSATRRSCRRDVWGDGDPEGVRQRAAQRDDRHRRGARTTRSAVDGRQRLHRLEHLALASTPSRRPSQDYWDDGLRRLRQALDADPGRRSTKQDVQLRPRGAPDRDRLRHRLRPARARGDRRPHAVRLQLRPVAPRLPGRRLRRSSSARFADRIFHVHMKDAWWGHGDGTVGVFGGHTTFGDARRYWDFRSRRPRRRQLRGDHRRAQRHRLPRAR